MKSFVPTRAARATRPQALARAVPGLACLLVVLCVAAQAHAGSVTDNGSPWVAALEMPRGTAMGGAQAAMASTNDAMVVNPAGLSQRKRYHVQLDGLWDQKFPAQGASISIVDSSSLAIGTGLMWQRFGAGEPQGRGEGWLFGMGYAYPAGGYNFGGTSKWLRFSTPMGDVRTFAQDIGFLSSNGTFSYAVVMQNISKDKIPLFPLTATTAFAFGSDTDWHFAFDYKVDLSDTNNLRHKLASGLEILFDQSIVVRAGYAWSPSSAQQWLSAGVGLVTDKLGVSISWRRRLAGSFDQFFQAGITLYLE